MEASRMSPPPHSAAANGADRGSWTDVIHLWSFGTGASISGMYFGWNYVLYGGFGSACVSAGLIMIMYTLLGLCAVELEASRKEITGGATGFVLANTGWTAGALHSILHLVTMLSALGITILATGAYIVAGLDVNGYWAPVIWLVCVWGFALTHIRGVELGTTVQVAITTFSVFILVVYLIAGFAGRFNPSEYLTDGLSLFDDGFTGFAHTFPFAMWFFYGVELMPLVSSETHRKYPLIIVRRAMELSLATLGAISALILVVGAGSAPGIRDMLRSTAPLVATIKYAYGTDSAFYTIFAIVVVLGLLASLHAFLKYSARHLEVVALEGLLPQQLAEIHPKFHTPTTALVTVAAFLPLIIFIAWLGVGTQRSGKIFVLTGVTASALGNVLQLVAYISRLESDAAVYARRPSSGSISGVDGARRPSRDGGSGSDSTYQDPPDGLRMTKPGTSAMAPLSPKGSRPATKAPAAGEGTPFLEGGDEQDTLDEVLENTLYDEPDFRPRVRAAYLGIAIACCVPLCVVIAAATDKEHLYALLGLLVVILLGFCGIFAHSDVSISELQGKIAFLTE